MDWYKNYKNGEKEKIAQYNRTSLYTHPDIDYGNQFGNNYVNPIHIPADPYHKQKEGKKMEYEYFLDEKDRMRKTDAIVAINRLAKAINELAKSHRKLKNAIDSDEYKELVRLIKSIRIKNNEDEDIKAELLQSIKALNVVNEKMKDYTLEALPDIYGIFSNYVDKWVSKNQDINILKRKYPKDNFPKKENNQDPKIERKYLIDLE